MLDDLNELFEDEEILSEEEEDDSEEAQVDEIDDVLLPLSYFDHGKDQCKQDIINKVKLFHEISRRVVTVATSNSVRYCVVCTLPDCKIKLNFYFESGITFCKLATGVQHTCSMFDHLPKCITPAALVQRPWVQEWMQKEQRSAGTEGLK